MFFFFSRNRKNRNSDAYAVNNYTLWDKFTTDLAAGSVNATNAEPVGGARTVTDTNTKISLTGGKLSFATGEAANDGIWYPAVTRVLGKTIILQSTYSSVRPRFGYDSNTSGYPAIHSFDFTGATTLATYDDTNGDVVVAVVAASTNYSFCIVLRATGAFWFIRGGAFSTWTLLWSSLTYSTSTLYPAIVAGGTTSVFTADNIRVPKQLYIPVPLQSDGMSAATTDGAGNAEANGPVGTAYTNVGTWGVSGGKRSCSALTGSGFSYLACGSTNIVADAAVTRTAGNAGLVVYTSATDYITAYTDGTNCVCAETVAGVTGTLRTGAVTYGAGNVIRLIIDGTTGRLFYNNLAVGASFTVAAPAANVGLYTTDTGNSFDNLIVWARGNEGQYNGLDAL